MVPPEGQGHDDGLGVGYFIRRGSAEDAGALADMRARLGDDVVDELLSSRERARHPQSLTESERVVIARATAPILHDLEASSAIVPEILYQTSGNYSRDGRDGVSRVSALSAHWAATIEIHRGPGRPSTAPTPTPTPPARPR
jgi:hypothetical protein